MSSSHSIQFCSFQLEAHCSHFRLLHRHRLMLQVSELALKKKVRGARDLWLSNGKCKNFKWLAEIALSKQLLTRWHNSTLYDVKILLYYPKKWYSNGRELCACYIILLFFLQQQQRRNKIDLNSTLDSVNNLNERSKVIGITSKNNFCCYFCGKCFLSLTRAQFIYTYNAKKKLLLNCFAVWNKNR